ncbi:S41 family peptidase [Bacteroidota bacterium]
MSKVFLYNLTISFLVAFILSSQTSVAQQSNPTNKTYIPALKRTLLEHEIFQPPPIQKKPGHYSNEDWQLAIDSVWGSGLPTTQKLAIFDAAIDTLDRGFGAFFNLDISLDSLVNVYRPEIENGVSRGRFAAIMNYISLYMKDTHTMLMDVPVNWGTPLSPGIPLLVIGGFMSSEHFGASLTPLPDSSLLVYRALSNHQLGLEAGDIVLGYDGIPWKILYKELMDAQLPISPTWIWGSTDASITHQILMSAGMNWHLFDTIDIIKYTTGDTVHLATAPLAQQTGFIWGNEQLPVAGVQLPDFINEDYVNWGILDGTDIGYLYIASYDTNPQLAIHDSIYQAVLDFMYNYETSGFIIDYRINYGGSIDNERRIYRELFNEFVFTIGYDVRTNPDDHYGMSPSSWATPYWLSAPGNPNSYYDKPIAILIGPGTVSAGDVESVRMSFHPRVKFFGKPSSGALTISRYPSLGNPDWFFYLAYGTAYLVSNHDYLCHTGVSVDEEVWLTQQGVVNGVDDVVVSAIDWINYASSVEETNNEVISGYYLGDNYPNPFNPETKISYTIPVASFVTLKIYDVLGNEISTLVEKQKSAGEYEVKFIGGNLPSGVYFYQLMADNYVNTKKMIFLK